VSAVKYELGFYIPEVAILHSHRRENLKSYRHLFDRFFKSKRANGVDADCAEGGFKSTESS
jgi:hypothetical protein